MHLHRVPDRREVQSWNGPGILPRPREEETVSDKKKYVRPGGLKGLWHGFKETIYGMSAHDMSRAALRTRASIEHLSVGCAIEPGWQNGNPGLHRNVYLHQGGICMRSKTMFALALAAAALLLSSVAGASAKETLSPNEELGKKLLFDKKLSTPSGLACAGCHGPEVGYTGPDAAINAAGAVYEGAVAGRFGNRKPPSVAYAGDSPILHWDGTKWVGGMFWDGRATGLTLGDPLAEQAQGPFLNPLEQNNASAQVVIDKVLASDYQDLFGQVCTDSNTYYECIGRSIAAYERSAEVSRFTSKYDYSLKGQATLTDQEQKGLELFNGKANCANCHKPPNFTDFTYDNLGVPRNLLNPFYNEPEWNPADANWIDTGLGGFLKAAGYPEAVYMAEWGKHKVPTLRNVDLRSTGKFVKAYSHNGYFKSLEEIVHFYNTRDVPGAGWPSPEVADNINTVEMGNLGMNHGEELAIVAFLGTLSDGYIPSLSPSPSPTPTLSPTPTTRVDTTQSPAPTPTLSPTPTTRVDTTQSP